MSEINRRDFVVSSIGYALAVHPIAAWAISTEPMNIDIKEFTIPTGNDLMPIYFAKPQKSKSPPPCIIVIQEIFGIHEYIKDVCKRLANQGYAVVAPYLYFRYGDVTQIPDFKKIISDVVSKIPQEQVMSDLDAVTLWLGSQKDLEGNKIGATGFCWGGNATWMYAAHNPKLKAAVAWYGRLQGDASPTQPKYPVDIAGQLSVPVLGLYGEKDTGIPLTQVEAMRAALAKTKNPSELITYPNAEHGFHADYRSSYNELAAKDGWNKLLEWFKKYGLNPV